MLRPTTRVERVGVHEMRAKGNDDVDQADGIDKSVLVIATPRRYRNREHLRYVAQQACLICGRKQSIRIISATCSASARPQSQR